jgi:hypothetical protein
MKRIIIMLLIACSAITTVNAQSKATAKASQNKPTNVIKSLEFIADLYGKKEGQTYAVTKNPNTNIIESSERVVNFTCDESNAYLTMISDDFMKDESVSYQILHIMPGSTQRFSLQVVTNDRTSSKTYQVRTKSTQEMWFLATKNPANPQLRDAYAIVWEPAADMLDVNGTIYMITSLRPDLYEESVETSNKTFKIEDGVGRNSGESLLNQRQMIGNDDVVADELVNDDVVADELVNDNVVADELAIDTIPGYNESFSQSSNWEPTPEQMMQVEAKGMAMKANMDAIKATYASLEPHFKMKSLTGSDRIFAQITKLNKELDVKFQDFIKYLNSLDVPPTEKAEKGKAVGEIYKGILKFYTEQNQGFTEMYKEVGVLTKAAQKTQKYINGLTEKYLKEMTKAVIK